MIKRILTIVLILMICGCTDRISLNTELTNLGYSQEDITLISSFNKEDIELIYKSYNEKLLNVIKDERCDKEKIKNYISYYNEFDLDTLFSLVNNDYINHEDWSKIRTLAKQKYFIIENLDLYLEYYDEINETNHLIGYINVGCYKTPYSDIETSLTDDEMSVIANKWHYLGDYEPQNLTEVEKKYAPSKVNPRLKKETIDAFIEMYEAATKDNINIYITSAYRSYITQVQLYNSYLNNDPIEVVDTYSSRPGHSDHQTGLAIDILSYGYNFNTFENSKAFEWLNENAYKYGFTLRYPKDKEDITGYMYESWHYRFVGKEIAEYLKDNDLTYDEYHAFFIERGLTNESA